MKLFQSVGDFFALDIGTTSVRVLQLKGGKGSWSLARYGSAPIDIKISNSESPEDRRRLGEIITSLLSQTGITARNVVLGVPSNKTFITVVDMPDVPAAELAATIKYQAEQYVPMSLDEAKLDWAVLGKSLHEENKIEVLLASVPNKFTEDRLDLVEGLGLNVISIEPDPLALVRSLVMPGSQKNSLLIDFSDFSTDVVAVIGDSPRIVRSLPTGMMTLVKAAQQNLSIDQNQAMQFILKFGLHPDRLEGQIYRALEATLEQFASEITKTVKFFQTRYPNVALSDIIVSGYAISIPAFSDYIQSRTSIQTIAGNPWQQVQYASNEQQNLMQLAPKFSVAIGLAESEL